MNGISKNKSGIVLLSHTVAHIVPSALRGLTSLFGMGRGVTPATKTPELKIQNEKKHIYNLISLLMHKDVYSKKNWQVSRIISTTRLTQYCVYICSLSTKSSPWIL